MSIGPGELFKELDGSIEHIIGDIGSSGRGFDSPHDSVKGLLLLIGPCDVLVSFVLRGLDNLNLAGFKLR